MISPTCSRRGRRLCRVKKFCRSIGMTLATKVAMASSQNSNRRPKKCPFQCRVITTNSSAPNSTSHLNKLTEVSSVDRHLGRTRPALFMLIKSVVCPEALATSTTVACNKKKWLKFSLVKQLLRRMQMDPQCTRFPVSWDQVQLRLPWECDLISSIIWVMCPFVPNTLACTKTYWRETSLAKTWLIKQFLERTPLHQPWALKSK